MFIDKLIQVFISPIFILINWLPEFTFTIPDHIASTIVSIFGAISYIVPWKGLLPIFSISCALIGARLTWAILLRIKSFIPTMGA